MSVRLRHPDLPGQDFDAPSSAVPFHRSSGWEPVEGQEDMGEVWPAELQPFEGQPPVRMRHPDVENKITVAESARPIWASSGWQVVEDDAEADAEAEPEADDAEAEGKPARRRRGKQQDQAEPEAAADTNEEA